MLNVEQITSRLAQMPDQALQKYAAMNKNDPYIMALAVSESNRRKELRQAAQGAQGQIPQPKVVDQDIQAMAAPMPEEVGIARLPAGPMNFADGGIVAFAGGGDVERYQVGGSTARNPLAFLNPGDFFGGVGRIFSEGIDPVAAEQRRQAALRRLVAPAEETVGTPEFEAAQQALRAKTAAEGRALPSEVAAAPVAAPAAPQVPGVSTAAPAVGGIGDLRAQFEKSIAGMKPEGAKSIQDYQAERAAMMPKEKAYAGLEAALQKEEAAAPKEKDEALWMSMIQGGLAAAAGSSTNALKNIAEGFGVGASGYKESLKEFKKAEKDRQKAMADIEQARRSEERGDVDAAYNLQDRAQTRMDNYNKGLMSAYASLTGQEMGSRATIQAAQIHANATSAAANRPSADIQLIERVMAEKKIPFTQALQDVMGMRREPATREAALKTWSTNQAAIQAMNPNIKTFEDYYAQVAGGGGGGGTEGFRIVGVRPAQ